MRIALDSNVFIAALSTNELSSSIAQQLIRDINKGNYQAIASSIVLGEVVGMSNPKDWPEIEKFFQLINNFSTIPADDTICLRAAALRRDQGSSLKLPDALHVATAIISGAEVFITDDKPLAKVAQKAISVTLLSQWS